MTKERGEAENVRVVVRCRPISKNEEKQGHKSIIEIDEVQGTLVANNTAAGEPPKTFTYDSVFGQKSKQTDVYNQAARPIVENILQGYNGTIFAYGQTGTGKTFTMEGDRSKPELKGIIPNSFAHIFDHIAKCGDEKRFLVRVSYLEIYQEDVRDLLAKNQDHKLEIKERPDVGVYVKDLSSVTVGCADEMDKIMTLGNKHRSVGATDMNEHSSRSHAIFTVTVECSELGPDKQRHFRVGKLHLVDLAGSERQSKTGAAGQRLKEAAKINLSLSTLGNVISALVDAKSSHVPYRNSKLTRLLQDSLGGNSKTVMCANVGPADYNYDETISTLRYANRAKNIKNAAKINEDPKDALLRKFQAEIEELRKQLEEDGEEGEEEEEEETEEGQEQSQTKHKKKKKPKHLSEEKMRQIETQISADRKKLEEEKDMAEGQRQQLAEQLSQREADLQAAREEHETLQKKLQQIEKKVIVGGENLLEKAEQQAKLLEQSNRELEERRNKETELKRALEQKQAERLDIEEKYSSLQEEAAGKTKKLKKVWTMLMSAKSEMNDLQAEHQREAEGLLDNVRELSRELRLQMLVIDSFIPAHYQEMIERFVHWNDDIGDWELKCIAYTGNNMRKRDPTQNDNQQMMMQSPDLSSAFLSYYADSPSKPVRQDSDELRLKAQRKSAKKERKAARIKALLQ